MIESDLCNKQKRFLNEKITLSFSCISVVNIIYVPSTSSTRINECRTFSTTITYNINHVFGGQNYSFSPQYFSTTYLGCDNIYHGEILPCLLRPHLPSFSYSTERYYNMEYKKKK